MSNKGNIITFAFSQKKEIWRKCALENSHRKRNENVWIHKLTIKILVIVFYFHKEIIAQKRHYLQNI